MAGQVFQIQYLFTLCRQSAQDFALAAPRAAGEQDNIQRFPKRFQRLLTIRFVTSSSVVASIVLPVSGTPAGSLATAFNFSDAWYVPSESGWGILMSHHVDTGGNMFVTVYLYDDQGRPKWYAISGGTWAGSQFSGDLLELTGPTGGFATLGGFDPTRVKSQKAGTATFNFSSRDSAQFTYNVGTASGTKTIQRLGF